MWQRWAWAQHETEGEPSDELLLAAIARGEETAFLIVYRRRQASIYRYALHLCGDADVTAETVQETFMALLRDAVRLDATRGTVLAWLVRGREESGPTPVARAEPAFVIGRRGPF